MDTKTKKSKTSPPLRILDLSGHGPVVRIVNEPVEPAKAVRFLDLDGSRPAAAPAVTKAEKNRRPRTRRKVYTFHNQPLFARHIPYLDPVRTEKLDKARDDVQEAIERLIRVNGAFVRELNTVAAQSNRIKHIIRAVEEVPFYCTVQRKIVADSVKDILESNAVQKKRRREKEQERLREIRRRIDSNRSWAIPDKSN